MQSRTQSLLAFVVVLATVALSSARDLSLALRRISQAAHPHARCLDGTPPAYYYRDGEGSGARSLIFFMEGGGWCYPSEIQQQCSKTSHCSANCHIRANSDHGSSLNYTDTLPPQSIEGGTGMTSGDPNKTAFSDFAVAYARYCDGGSFSGTKTEPDVALNGTGPLYYAGKYNLDAVTEDIVQRATAAAGAYDRIIVSGCSAGGMSCYLHCDYISGFFQRAFPGVDVRCMCDAGVFLDVPTVTGAGNIMRKRFFDLADRMDTKPSLNPACVAAEPDWRECMFSEVSLKYTKTPLFAMNSMYNFGEWEMLAPPTSQSFPPDTTAAAPAWAACWPTTSGLSAATYARCNETQKLIIQNHADTFKEAMSPVTDPATPHGGWLSSCPSMHCQSGFSKTVTVSGLTVGDAAARWYFNGSAIVKLVDGHFPGNPTCPKSQQ